MVVKLGVFAALLGAVSLALAQAPAAAPVLAPAASAPIRLSDLPLPAPHLLREHAEAARVQSEIERMQREQSLMQARIAHEQAQRQMRQAMGASDLPKIVAVMDAQDGARALLRNAAGLETVVRVGDRIAPGLTVRGIDAHGVRVAAVEQAGRQSRERVQTLVFAKPPVADQQGAAAGFVPGVPPGMVPAMPPVAMPTR